MNDKIYEIKAQAGNLCDALHRNINNNFESVSFEIHDDGTVQVQIVLSEKTGIEEEYIDDMMVEFVAQQQSDCVLEPKIKIGKNNFPLQHIVYQK